MAFGKSGVIGALAVNDIHVRKAFIFVPFKIIITPQMVKESELKEVIKAFPQVFDNSAISWDYLIWIFLMNERRKGRDSFFYPYINVIDQPEILCDWSESELSELQDGFLSKKTKKLLQSQQFHYSKLLPVFTEYPNYFPATPCLFSTFYWAYKVVTTRAFSPNEGMLIPLADCLNHEDVSVDYITLTQEFLEARSSGLSLINDYQDFLGASSSSCNIMKTRTHKNRLEKYLSWFDTEKIQDMNAIWEIDQILHELESSTDEEDPIHISTSDESSEEEGDDFDMRFDPSNKYFVMRTKEKASFKAGTQVFNCYGRLNNFDMLIDYGFCLYPNKYDSCYIRLFKCKLVSPALDRKKKGTRTFNLKLNQLNADLLSYLRKRMNLKESYLDPVSSSKSELNILHYFQCLLEEYLNNFPTTLEQDLEIMNGDLHYRLEYAIKYRISLKEIIRSQVSLSEILEQVLVQVAEGKSVISAHWADRSIEACKKMYPLRTYLGYLNNGELW